MFINAKIWRRGGNKVEWEGKCLFYRRVFHKQVTQTYCHFKPHVSGYRVEPRLKGVNSSYNEIHEEPLTMEQVRQKAVKVESHKEEEG